MSAPAAAQQGGAQISAVPVGGVEAGDKGAPSDTAGRGLLLGTALLLAATAGTAAATGRHRRKQ